MFFNLTFYSGDFCKIQRILAEILHSLLIMGIKKEPPERFLSEIF